MAVHISNRSLWMTASMIGVTLQADNILLCEDEGASVFPFKMGRVQTQGSAGEGSYRIDAASLASKRSSPSYISYVNEEPNEQLLSRERGAIGGGTYTM